MRYHNSVFHALLKHVPWAQFDRLVEAHGADARVRRLTTKSQFVALLYGQLSGAASLREIVTGLESHAARLYHLGADPVRRSTLSDANAQRPVAVFAALSAVLMQQARRGLRRKLAEVTYLIDPAGYDAGKKIKGKKRHVLVDTQGLLMQAIIHAADIQDRDGGMLLMGALFGLYPFLLKLYADSGYQGRKFHDGLKTACGQINLEIVKRSDVHRFVVLPKRWIVERSIGWFNRCRRLAKDWECLNRNGLAFLRWASIRLMLRKLCNPS